MAVCMYAFPLLKNGSKRMMGTSEGKLVQVTTDIATCKKNKIIFQLLIVLSQDHLELLKLRIVDTLLYHYQMKF